MLDGVEEREAAIDARLYRCAAICHTLSADQ